MANHFVPKETDRMRAIGEKQWINFQVRELKLPHEVIETVRAYQKYETLMDAWMLMYYRENTFWLTYRVAKKGFIDFDIDEHRERSKRTPLPERIIVPMTDEIRKIAEDTAKTLQFQQLIKQSIENVEKANKGKNPWDSIIDPNAPVWDGEIADLSELLPEVVEKEKKITEPLIDDEMVNLLSDDNDKPQTPYVKQKRKYSKDWS